MIRKLFCRVFYRVSEKSFYFIVRNLVSLSFCTDESHNYFYHKSMICLLSWRVFSFCTKHTRKSWHQKTLASFKITINNKKLKREKTPLFLKSKWLKEVKNKMIIIVFNLLFWRSSGLHQVCIRIAFDAMRAEMIAFFVRRIQSIQRYLISTKYNNLENAIQRNIIISQNVIQTLRA